MSTAPTYRLDLPHIAEREERFGICDSKGREIGAFVALWRVEVTAEKVPGSWATTRAPGTYFAMCPQATRDGKSFGALQPEQLFETEAQRDAAVAKYFAGARKRAPKVRT